MSKRNVCRGTLPTARTDVPDVLSRLQGVLSALANIDSDCEDDLEAVRASAANEDIKTVAMGNLRQLYGRRRAPLVHELIRLEERLRA